MELLGFQLGNMGHHTFITWSRAGKVPVTRAVATPPEVSGNSEEDLEKNLMLTAFSL